MSSDNIVIESQAREIERLKQWISDVQSGMYINCVYCGHRYGPSDEVPASMADVLKEHVEQCPKHPMSKLKEVLERIKRVVQDDSLTNSSIMKSGILRIIEEIDNVSTSM